MWGGRTKSSDNEGDEEPGPAASYLEDVVESYGAEENGEDNSCREGGVVGVEFIGGHDEGGCREVTDEKGSS